jgi:hypothetical protein
MQASPNSRSDARSGRIRWRAAACKQPKLDNRNVAKARVGAELSERMDPVDSMRPAETSEDGKASVSRRSTQSEADGLILAITLNVRAGYSSAPAAQSAMSRRLSPTLMRLNEPDARGTLPTFSQTGFRPFQPIQTRTARRQRRSRPDGVSV